MSDHFIDLLEQALARAEGDDSPEAELAGWRALGPLVLRQMREHAEVVEERDDLRVIERSCRKALKAVAQYAEHHRTCEMRGRARSKPRRCTCGLTDALALLDVARELAPE